MSSTREELGKVLDDTLVWMTNRLRLIAELKEDLEQEEAQCNMQWGAYAPSISGPWSSYPGLVLEAGYSPEYVSVELARGQGLRAMVDAVKRFCAAEDRHDGVLSVQYIGQHSGGYDTCLIFYRVKKDTDES